MGRVADTRTVQKRYDRSARLYDLSEGPAERLLLRRLRGRLWKRVEGGSILELGVGTGKNIVYYPPTADVVAIDISREMLDRARLRAKRLERELVLGQMDAQQLAFADSSFDAVVGTFIFCSVPDPILGLREAWRVAKPGGSLLLLEHVRSANRLLGFFMDLANPLMVRMTGANINRDTVGNVAAVGLKIELVEDLWMGIVKLISARVDK